MWSVTGMVVLIWYQLTCIIVALFLFGLFDSYRCFQG